MRWKYCSELGSYQLEKLLIEVELIKTSGGSNHDSIVFITAKERKAGVSGSNSDSRKYILKEG